MEDGGAFEDGVVLSCRVGGHFELVSHQFLEPFFRPILLPEPCPRAEMHIFQFRFQSLRLSGFLVLGI